MASRFEYWVGGRYVRSRSRNSFVSLISTISMLGIAIAVAVLIVVLSVVNGFERELRDRLLAMTSHASVYDRTGRLVDWEAMSDIVESRPDVLATSPYVTGQALLVFEEQLSGAELRGVDPALEDEVSGIGDVFVEGELSSLEVGDFNIVLGVELANELEIGIGDKVTVTLAQGVVTPAGVVPRTKRFTVRGIYRVGMYEFDRRLAYIHIDDARRLYRLGDDVTGVRFSVTDVFKAPEISEGVAVDLIRATNLQNLQRVDIVNWTERNRNFFRSIQITKSILFVILLLVVAVAAFNIVSTLVMVVKDKQADIAILRTVGAMPSSIVRIFVTQGAVIGIVGTAVGVLFGVLLSLNLETIVSFVESTFGIKFLAADVYFISDLPSQLKPGDVIRIASIALGLALVSTLYPAWMAARTAPAEALRYD
ncbi:MAG: lipoprotein-releasing ABC transporter permease subunit [Woeseiaceae bacterium]|nr:lipoprotein-releasing ABC transporter permease subunit [Woeseiaceae bacterium]